MNKVICDICGTLYPETESKCPVCGAARRPEDQVVAVEEPAAPVTPPPMPKKSSNRGLIITIIILLLAIIAMSAYIGMRFFGLFSKDTRPEPTKPTGIIQTEEPTENKTLPCAGVVLGNNVVELNAAGMAWLLDVKLEPAKTTDTVSFATSDPAVAEVTPQGRITAVGPGQAIITVTCGQIQKECRVVCDFEADPDAQTQETEATTPVEHFQLNRDDITFSGKGETFRFRADGLENSQITWSSDNEKVASIENGTVTAVGSGTTTIHGTYDGKEASCIVRCNFEDDTDQETETTEPEDKGVHLTHEDVSISQGETFTLRLLKGDSSRIDVSFSSADSSVADISGNTVTGNGSGITRISAEYEGTTYTCIVRVK